MKNMHVNMSAAVVCRMLILKSSANFAIQTKSADLDQTSTRSSLIWVHTVCNRDVLYGQTDNTADNI